MNHISSKIIYVVFSFLLTGCAHSVHQVHAGDFYPYSQDQKRINAHAQQYVVMGFTDNTNYVNDALRELMAACKGGKILGTTTEFMTDLGFFSWTNHIYMQGSCVRD